MSIPPPSSSTNVRIDFSLKDDAGAPVFGYLQRGSRTGIDAAKSRLISPQDALTDIPKVREIRGCRSMVYPTDQGISVEMYGAKSRYGRGEEVWDYVKPAERNVLCYELICAVGVVTTFRGIYYGSNNCSIRY